MGRHGAFTWGRLGTFAVLGLALVGGLVLAQDQSGERKAKPYVPRKIVLSPQPVTRNEARKVFEKVGMAINKVIPAVKPVSLKLSGNQPITRTEVINHFAKIFESTRPQFKINPVRSKVDMSEVMVKDPAARAKLEMLIAWRCVDEDGALATNSKETLHVTEFGDAVGLLMARLADLTHTATPEFSPNPEPTQPG